jgi:hypothetical protein
MKKLFYIDYPQEHVEGQMHTYRCAFCKVITTKINGNLDGHLPTCEYRIKLERAGFENIEHADKPASQTTDETD